MNTIKISSRMRKILVSLVVVLVALGAAGGYYYIHQPVPLYKQYKVYDPAFENSDNYITAKELYENKERYMYYTDMCQVSVFLDKYSIRKLKSSGNEKKIEAKIIYADTSRDDRLDLSVVPKIVTFSEKDGQEEVSTASNEAKVYDYEGHYLRTEKVNYWTRSSRHSGVHNKAIEYMYNEVYGDSK